MAQELIAAIDLGSNSFRLEIGRVVDDQIYIRDSLKEPVRLAAGLSENRMLDEEACARTLSALSRFHERLAGYPPENVRAVATNTFRVAKNAPQLLAEAEKALGFPIEIIAGREEARLIYLGVSHAMPDPSRQTLVVDIGGGSTEFIIGKSLKPLVLESLYMGCVGYSLRFFPDGEVDKQRFKEAELAARKEIQGITRAYCKVGWELAVGSSGSARTLCDILEQNGWSSAGITRHGLRKLKSLLLKSGNVSKLELEGLRSERVPVLAGGLAIMTAIFKEFDLEQMQFSEGALRLGVLYDLLGRYHNQDQRDLTVKSFMRRYRLDARQAEQVAQTASALYEQLNPETGMEEDNDRRFLRWAALLHEIGISIAHASYHKHSAYIVGNADMPGFSRKDQLRLAQLVLGHRGKLERFGNDAAGDADWCILLCLRLAVIFHRSRSGRGLPAFSFKRQGKSFLIGIPGSWLQRHPLTAAALEEEERAQWETVGRKLIVEVSDK